MNFDFYIDFWKRGVDFKGRSSREEYWYAYLVNCLITLLTTLLLFIPFVSVLQSVWALAVCIPTIAISVRRLHDSNHTCMPIVIILIIETISAFVFLVSFLVMFIMIFAAQDSLNTVLICLLIPGIIMFVCIVVHIIYMCLPSTIGMNKYGEMREKLNFKSKSKYKQEQPMNFQDNMQRDQMNMNQENPYFQSYEKTYGKMPENNYFQNNNVQNDIMNNIPDANVHNNEQNPV